MYNPISTYRIQFHSHFTFKDFEAIIPYLQQLGISTIYASPIFEAVPGSMHGYDVVNPLNINPEIGTKEQLIAISKKLKEAGIGWIQDIVPNHMAYHPNNPWVMDVLEKGPQSEYVNFFDITWSSNLFNGKIIVPFLGEPLEEALEKKLIKVANNDGHFHLEYYDNRYPLHLRSYKTLLEVSEDLPSEDIATVLDQIQNIQRIEAAKQYTLRMHELQLEITALMKEENFKAHIEKCIQKINQDVALLRKITDEQVYRLCHWQETDKHINYRRFFTVNGLICLNIHEEEVFHEYHQLIKSLVEEGIFDGLRVDHIDGLFDPSAYLERLRQTVGEEVYVIVEKILVPDEKLPDYWSIQGETGYGFLAKVNNLFTKKENEEKFTTYYADLVGKDAAVQQQIHDKKAYILHKHMQGELDNLYQLFLESELIYEEALNTINQERLKQTIGEFMVQCPVYRYYGNSFPLVKEEEAAIRTIFSRITESDATLTPEVKLLEEILLNRPQKGDEDFNKCALKWYQRLMQFTGPLMAKGVEDTLMYTFNRFIGHNEVGDSPEAFGLSVESFHEAMKERQAQWPLALNATATHDTKRGEDVRMRLNVLTDLPEEWVNAVNEWRKMNAGLKQDNAPDENDEYLIYQTLIGAYPLIKKEEDNFGNRLQEYLQKALREAKSHSNWSAPNEAYEEATKAFAISLLDKNSPFWKRFEDFQARVADYGIINTLAQVLLKFTCPGTPDLYQGTELWDLSLVDPDNRRPVDFEERAEISKIEDDWEDSALWENLWQNRHNGQVKLMLVKALLHERKNNAALFLKGEYIPLKIEGIYNAHIMAFARKHNKTTYITAIPLHLAVLCKEQGCEWDGLDWKDTSIVLPKGISGEWKDILLKTTGTTEDKLNVQGLFTELPIALLKVKEKATRASGILLHITSLASPFGIGDLGPETRAFADFLQRSDQKYWQLLPLNPIEAGQFYSPYSATCSMAGNTLLISPEILAKDGLLDGEPLATYHLPQEGKTLYKQAEQTKETIFNKAWENFKAGDFEKLRKEFEDFKQNNSWLHDFALFDILKTIHKGAPWFEWPKEYQVREKQTLEILEDEYATQIERAKWLQFIFFKQWKSLRNYCNNKEIELIGDMPFYISYDSVDVWVNKSIFRLDEEGSMVGIAGVPPDYFNEDGQLWGMPVFDWKVLKEKEYGWWIARLKTNLALFDKIRLDHFRAFANFWEVPSGEDTARNGEWKTGPGADFFEFVGKALGNLPFIAEDLGEMDDAVFALRDKYKFPGMKILQFAFGEELPNSPYIPHNFTPNFIVYPGTHDNNTTRGWYREEGKQYHEQIEKYCGRTFTEDDIPKAICHLAFASVAQTAILTMQDILGLDEQARMNLPGSAENNWLWRLLPGQITPEAENWLKELTWLFGRG